MKDSIPTIVKTVRDTVFVKVDTDLVDAYQKLIDSQAQTYNIIITVFVGIAALFAGATWLYNRKLAKKDIETAVNETFEAEKKQFLDGQKLEFKKELNQQKAESARLFALVNNAVIESSDENDDAPIFAYVNLVYWWHEVIVNNILSSNLFGERLGVDNLGQSLKSVIEKGIEKDFLFQYLKIYKFEDLYTSLNYITDSLKAEKDQIYELLNTIAKTANYKVPPENEEK